VSQTRVIVARHRAPEPGKRISVGKCVGEYVYELFITTVPAEGFLVEDVLDLYHGRGAFEAVLADEDLEEDPDRWCSYTECGQELWQVACQWIWNLRLSLGKRMQEAELREMEWAPPKEAPPSLGRCLRAQVTRLFMGPSFRSRIERENRSASHPCYRPCPAPRLRTTRWPLGARLV